MEENRIIHVSNYGYRTNTTVEWIKGKFGHGLDIIDKSPNILFDEIDSVVASGDIVVIGLYDLYNELAYAEYTFDSDSDGDSSRVSKYNKDTNISSLSKNRINDIVISWKLLARLYLRYQNNPKVYTVNGNLLYNSDAILRFDNDEWNRYYDNWIVNIVNNDDILVTLSESIFGSIEIGNISEVTTKDTLDRIINSLPVVIPTNVVPNITDVVICTQDIEHSVVDYVTAIIKSYSNGVTIHIYDIGSIDNTYHKLQELLYHNIILTQLTRTNARNRANIIMKAYDVNTTNVFINSTASISVQDIESFCTVATNNVKHEVNILIKSIRVFYDIPIYIECDIHTKTLLIDEGYTNIEYSIIDESVDIDDIIPVRSTDNGFHNKDAIYRKMETMRNALLHHSNTMFLDADIILVDEIIIESDSELILSLHGFDSVEAINLFGMFNAGYLFTSNSTLPDVWEDLYQNNSNFYEQEGMKYFIGMFDTDVFSDAHNIGVWGGIKGLGVKHPISFHLHTDHAVNTSNFDSVIFETNIFVEHMLGYLKRIKSCLYENIVALRDGNTDDVIDTSLIMGNWGYSEERRVITINTIEKCKQQKGIHFKLIFVEVIFDGELSILHDYDFDGEHIIINGTSANRNIFQKEALWNIGISHATTKFVIFMDGDIFSNDEYWFHSIIREIHHDNSVVHGFNLVTDTGDATLDKCSLIRNMCIYPKITTTDWNSGLIYGMKLKYITDIGGFNTMSPFSDGDLIFIIEVGYNNTSMDGFRGITTFDGYSNIYYNLPKLRTLECADFRYTNVDIFHSNHGDLNSRLYGSIFKLLAMYGSDVIYDLVELDSNGLLMWKDELCWLNSVLPRLHNFSTVDDIRGLVEEYKMGVVLS